MSYLLGYITAASANSNSATTAGLDTSDSDLIVLAVGYDGGAGTPTVTDSKGNSWSPLTVRGTGSPTLCLYYCVNPTVGAGHTFSATLTSGKPTISALAFIGATNTPFDQENGTASTGNITAHTGSITPSEDGVMLVAVVVVTSTAAQNGRIDDGDFVRASEVFASATNYYLATYCGVQQVAAAVNPSIVWGATADYAISITSFKSTGSASGITGISRARAANAGSI